MDNNEYRWPWMAELNKRMLDAFFKTKNEEDYPMQVLADLHFNDGSFVEVELYKSNNSVNCYYYHGNDADRDCPNITGYIEDNLYSWDEMLEQYEDAQPEDEWQAHGFRNEADYWHYRLG